jgi:hypothetical protein
MNSHTNIPDTQLVKMTYLLRPISQQLFFQEIVFPFTPTNTYDT